MDNEEKFSKRDESWIRAFGMFLSKKYSIELDVRYIVQLKLTQEGFYYNLFGGDECFDTYEEYKKWAQTILKDNIGGQNVKEE